MITLDVISDPVCPWCYIGKHRLYRALEQKPDHPFAIRWHAFQLDPSMSPEGIAFSDYLEMRFGDQKAVLEALKQVNDIGLTENIEMDLAKIKRVPNTTDAHRLIHWAGMEEKQNAAVDRLFSAHFREGKDIGDRDVLLDIANSIGMDFETTKAVLNTDADIDTVKSADRGFRQSGITAVPSFIVSNHYVVQGAQASDFWVDVIDEILTKTPNI